MITKLTTNQRAVAGSMSRAFPYGAGGFPDLLDDMLGQLAGGTFGVQAAGGDVDSLALGGGAFSVDQDNTTGLTFAYRAGRLRTPAGVVAASAGSLPMAASAVNYVEVDGSGVVSSNTVGFTAGRCRLYVVTAGTATLATIANAKALLSCAPPASIGGTLLTAAAATRSTSAQLGTVAATVSCLLTAPAAGRVTAAVLAAAAAVAVSDAGYWTYALANAGQAGTGTTALLVASPANTTRATGGTAIAASAARPLALVTPTGAGELNVAANDCLVFTATATGSPPQLAGLHLRLDVLLTA